MAVPLDLFCSHTEVLLQPYLAAFLLWSDAAPYSWDVLGMSASECPQLFPPILVRAHQ